MDRELLFEKSILLTATVTISAPDIYIDFNASISFLYFPVPTKSLDEKVLLEIHRSSFFN